VKLNILAGIVGFMVAGVYLFPSAYQLVNQKSEQQMWKEIWDWEAQYCAKMHTNLPHSPYYYEECLGGGH
jgi:hypothetical protein